MSVDKGRFWCSNLLDVINNIGRREGWTNAEEQLIFVLRAKFLAAGLRFTKEINENKELSEDAIKKVMAAVAKFADLNLLGWKIEPVSDNAVLQKGECLLRTGVKDAGLPKEFKLNRVCAACLTGLARSVGSQVSVTVEDAKCMESGDKEIGDCKFIFVIPEFRTASTANESGFIP